MTEKRNPFHGPFTTLANDELSCEAELGEACTVSDGDRLLGEVCRVHVNGHGTTWAARSAHYAEYGAVPGRPTGWVHGFERREAAEDALRRHFPHDTGRKNEPESDGTALRNIGRSSGDW